MGYKGSPEHKKIKGYLKKSRNKSIYLLFMVTTVDWSIKIPYPDFSYILLFLKL